MRGKLTGWRDITLQFDRLETETKDIIQTMFLGLDHGTYQRTRENLTKLVKAAFFAGRDQIIDELNDRSQFQPDSIKLRMCACGSSACTRAQFTNVGHFAMGAGFSMAEANRIMIGWDLASPNGDRTAKVTMMQNADGTVEIIDAEFTEIEQEAPHGWVFYGPDGNWHWSINPDYHESVEDLRPATAIEAALAQRP